MTLRVFEHGEHAFGPAGRPWGVSVTPLHRNDLLPHAETFAQAALGSTAFAETFAQVAQVSRHLPRRLRKLRKFRGTYRDVCAGCANTAAFTETFAQAALGSAAFTETFAQAALGSAAFAETFAQAALGSAAFPETFAGFPQTPKSFSRRLRGSRKRQKVFRGTCGTPANTHNSVKMSVRWRLAFFLTQGAGA